MAVYERRGSEIAAGVEIFMRLGLYSGCNFYDAPAAYANVDPHTAIGQICVFYDEVQHGHRSVIVCACSSLIKRIEDATAAYDGTVLTKWSRYPYYHQDCAFLIDEPRRRTTCEGRPEWGTKFRALQTYAGDACCAVLLPHRRSQWPPHRRARKPCKRRPWRTAAPDIPGVPPFSPRPSTHGKIMGLT